MNFFNKKNVFRYIITFVIVLFWGVFLYFFNQVVKPDLVSTQGRTFEKAVVTEITQDNIQENGSRVGEQHIKVKIKTGSLKGKIFDATSSDGKLFGATCEVGSKVVVIVSSTDNDSLVSVYSLDREFVIYAFVFIFFFLLCLIGGKNGFKSSLSLIFDFICIIFLYIPMIFKGFSPFFSAVLVVILTTIITMYLIAGFSAKSIAAMIGTTFGVIISGISAAIFGYFAGISGYNVSDIESLLFVEQNTNIQVGGLLFSGILIAALGAVMDVAMSIASTINEIHENSPELSIKQLFMSGINVGRDMMGTMSNTLILAFTGDSLSVLILNYVYDLPYKQIINSYSIGIEIMQGLSGSIGIILTVPLVSLVASILIHRKKTQQNC